MSQQGDYLLLISVAEQRCRLMVGDACVFEAPVSTALNGVGELKDSGCTPRGHHIIRACIGSGLAKNAVFIGRRPTGEYYNSELAQQYPERDWILTRVMWLSGMEVGRNRLRNVDTMQRYIYIHGCPDEVPMGEPLSHGCVRMRNDDVKVLFELVKPGTHVMISE
jgi:hypothetical protein